MNLSLRYHSSEAWIKSVLSDFDAFLVDHAAAEKKASGMALSMLSHYPDKPKLVEAMVSLSIEEMMHFREVIAILHQRGLQLGPDNKDHYVNALRKQMRQGTDVYLLDRLLIAAIIEARGCERFGLIGERLEPGSMQQFYRSIAASEAKHHTLFIDLANIYFSENTINPRLDELLDIEADLCAKLPIIAALH